jgi:hypothetical protein
MADAQVEFGGERVGPEAAPDPGTPLPSRPARAVANESSAWHNPVPVVPDNATAGVVDHTVNRSEYCGDS